MSLPPFAGPAPMRRRLTLAALLAVTLVAAWALWRYALQGPAPAAIPNYAQQPVPVSVAAARSGPLPRDLHALGTITPLAQVVLLSLIHISAGRMMSRQ